MLYQILNYFTPFSHGINTEDTQEVYSDTRAQIQNMAVMHEIQKQKNCHKKINLCIGICPDAELPYGDSKTVWISLSLNDYQKNINKALAKGRLHLTIDVNKTDQMYLIKNIFNEIVVDYATVKCFEDGGFSNIYDALQKGGRLIFEPALFPPHVENEKDMDSMLNIRNFRIYNKKRNEFIVDFVKEKMNIVVDNNQITDSLEENMSIICSKQMIMNEDLVRDLNEFKEWKKKNHEVIKTKEIESFFEYLTEENGLINPEKVRRDGLLQDVIKKRNSEMRTCFKDVRFVKEKFPYNNLNYHAEEKIEYFIASKRK